MIRISDPELMPALVERLRRSEFVVEELDAQTLSMRRPSRPSSPESILRKAARELRLYLGVWRVLHPECEIELEAKTRR